MIILRLDCYCVGVPSFWYSPYFVPKPDKDGTGNVEGLFLYAKTDEAVIPDCMFNMGGNQIGAKTFDLNADFKVIAAQLDAIAEQFFDKGEGTR